MPDEPEIETHELQEHVEEAHHHAADAPGWTKYVALSTAAFAAFAAVGALQAGALANSAMMDQIRAADGWNEYQSDKLKAHTFEIETNRLLDQGIVASAIAKDPKPRPRGNRAKADRPLIGAQFPADRLAEYQQDASRETEKAAKLSEDAKKREHGAETQMESHEHFAYAVAMLQVAIALGAVSALTRSRPVWIGSGAVGLIGIGFFVLGFIK